MRNSYYNPFKDEYISKINSVGVCGSGTHMGAPEAYKPYVGGNSNRCGTTRWL